MGRMTRTCTSSRCRCCAVSTRGSSRELHRATPRWELLKPSLILRQKLPDYARRGSPEYTEWRLSRIGACTSGFVTWRWLSACSVWVPIAAELVARGLPTGVYVHSLR